jgi:hypothetical protein
MYCKELSLGMKAGVFNLIQETKHQSMEWCGTSPKQKKVRLRKSCIKTMFFFDAAGVIHRKFVPEGIIVIRQYHLGVMQRLFVHMQRIKKELFQKKIWLLFHDNAPVHCALPVMQVLASKLMCAQTSALFTRFGSRRPFAFPQGEVCLKRRAFQ